MSIRIYALAKQLQIESKALVDLCKSVGIDGKGSALASLTPEEVDLVKKSIENDASSKPTKKSAEDEAMPAFQRPTQQQASGKVPVLKVVPTKSKPKEPESAVLAVQDEHKEELTSQVAETTEPSLEIALEADTFTPVSPEERPETEAIAEPSVLQEQTEQSTVVPLEEGSSHEAGQDSPEFAQDPAPITTGLSSVGHAASVRGENYRAPMRSITDKIPVISDRKKSRDSDKPSGGSQSKSSGPTIRLAPVPKGATVAPSRDSKEPAPQKPDMKLPPEAIRAAAMGAAQPLTDHIRNHEEKQRLSEEERKTGKRPALRRGKEATESAVATPDVGKAKPGVRKRGRDGRLIGGFTDETTPAQEKRRGTGHSKRNRGDDFDESGYIPRQLRRQKKNSRPVSSAPRKSDIVVQLPCTVKQFAEMTGLSVASVLKKLIEFGTPTIMTAPIERDTAELLVEAFDLRVEVRDEVSLEDRLVTSLFEQEDPEELLAPRPPIVTFLGHVDHGKTSLLDRIIGLDVASGERGGITQHIRAYRVKTEHGDVTFVDTPGHEAFTEMRARGANSTDIAVLVVAADDGVMPQTEEAISHIKAAGVPIVVALNKIDLPGANPDKALQELAANELMPSEWGGDVEVVRCSAITGEGMDELMQTLLTVAELHELKANPSRAAIGVVLEAELQTGQGVVCKTLVRNGTLRVGDVILCDCAFGRVKAMFDTLDTKLPVDEAPPSTPVNVIGLDVVPTAGSRFCVLDDISDARQIAEKRANEMRRHELADVQTHITLETLYQKLHSATAVQMLNIIIRADVRGSIDAIKKELTKLDHAEVKVKIIQALVGGITEADVQLADASDAIIVGFNVVPDENARNLAEKKKIQIRRYDIIYNLTADIKAALEGMLKPLSQVKELGRALVQRIFSISRLGAVAGCRVLAGNIERDSRIRLIRDSRIIGEYPLDSLKREKDDAKEVREGYECGIKLKGFNDLKEGDILEAYKMEEIARTF